MQELSRNPNLNLDFDGPTQLSGMGPGIAEAFLRRRTDHTVADAAVKSFPQAFFEGFLYQTVLTGVEGENGYPGTGIQNPGELLQKGIEHLKFGIHVDAQGLEGSLAGFPDFLLTAFLRQEGKGIFNDGI